MSAELAIVAKLQDEASSGIRALRGEIEGIEPSTGVAAKGFAALQTVGAAALMALAAAAVAVGGAIVTFAGFMRQRGEFNKEAALRRINSSFCPLSSSRVCSNSLRCNRSSFLCSKIA